MPAMLPLTARGSLTPAAGAAALPLLAMPCPTRRGVIAGAIRLGIGAALFGASTSSVGAVGANGCDRDDAEPGLVSDDAWIGPSIGLEVSWQPSRWSVGTRSNRYVANAMGREDRPVDCGFGQGASDRLTLVNGMWESGVYLIESYDRLMWTPDSMADAMSQPGWVQNLRVPQGSPLLLGEATSDTLAAVAGDAEKPEHTVYWQATFPEDDETVIHNLTLHMWEAGAVYALHDLDGVEISGIDPFTVVDLETVRAAIDDYLG